MTAGNQPRIAIVGAGPTGLGAAWRLMELGYTNWTMVESTGEAGGLAASVIDGKGFTWDKGGHVIFSHYDYFDQLLDHLMGEDWVDHVREAWVWIRERFIPYPFQNNIWRLPDDDLKACLDGLAAIQSRAPAAVSSFDDWILNQFGEGLADIFFRPYNFKVWAYPPTDLDACWMLERVATVDFQRILRNVELKKDDLGWGPNTRFRFPLRGGTGEIWKRLAALIPSANLRPGNAVVSIDSGARTLTLFDGSRINYDYLLSTMPLDGLLDALTDRSDLRSEYKRKLLFSSTNLVGVGLQGAPPEMLRTKCWMYFAEPEIPFYRATVFSNYSPYNVPEPGFWSLLCEVSESRKKPVDLSGLKSQVVQSLKACGFVKNESEIVSLWQHRLPHGYPTPFLGRDQVLAPLDAALTELNIHSRGRFGGWKYEVANQDHSLMQGVEFVDHVLHGLPEETYNDPAKVNSRRDTTRRLKVPE